MGQYHMVYNVDKKQYIHGHEINNGLKLVEQIGWEKSTSSALFLLLANSNGRGNGDVRPHPMIGAWAGDRIVLQGDYVETWDRGYVDLDAVEFENISGKVKEMLDYVFGADE